MAAKDYCKTHSYLLYSKNDYIVIVLETFTFKDSLDERNTTTFQYVSQVMLVVVTVCKRS